MNCSATARNCAGDSYPWRPPTHRTQGIKGEMTRKMPFFHRKTLISRELRKTAASDFRFCNLGRKGFHLGFFGRTSRIPSPRGGARAVRSRDFKNCRTGKIFSPPLLKMSPILLKFGMIALKTFIH